MKNVIEPRCQVPEKDFSAVIDLYDFQVACLKFMRMYIESSVFT